MPSYMLQRSPELMKIGVFLTTSRHATHSSTKNTSQLSEMLPMENIYMSIVTQKWHTPKKYDLPRYYDPEWYKPKGIDNILSLGLVQKNHPVTYNSQDWNELVVHIPQRPTFKMTNYGLFYHDIGHLLKNKEAHIMVNKSHSPISQVQDKKKRYISCNINGLIVQDDSITSLFRR